MGLAHTRWATHGRPNDLNAHPHRTAPATITVIHNGIIENFRELRDGLEERGHVLDSETDTEALAHLVEEAYEGDLADAVRAALRRVEGAYAIVVMHREEAGRLVGARQDVPLVVGLAWRGVVHRQRRRRDPGPHQPDRLPRGRRRRRRPPQRRRRHRRRRGPARAGRDDHRLVARGRREGRLRALHAQGDPRAARRPPPVARGAGGPRRPDPRGRDRALADVLEGGSPGSSWSPAGPPPTRRSSAPPRSRPGPACRPGSTVGSEFRYSPPPLDERTLVIAVTQSGETADTIAPTRYARERGCPIIAVTNTVGSAITREADAVLFLQAGPEIAVAASKTFVTQVTTLVVLAAAIGRLRGSMTEAERGGPRGRPSEAARGRHDRPGAQRPNGAATSPGST